jgi:alanyl aminopeptidase
MLQLPDDVAPTHYTVQLDTDPARVSYRGSVVMKLAVRRPTTVVAMHAQGLTLKSVTVTQQARQASARKQRRMPTRWKVLDAQHGLVQLQLAEPLLVGEAEVRIEYTGNLSTNLTGFYQVKRGAEHYAYTQFEPYSARTAFPCLDEPRFKATFELSLTVPKDTVAVSNTRAVRDQILPHGARRFQFARTLPLSTYLVAWAVGPFDVVPGPTVPASAVRARSVALRGIAVRGRGKEFAYALTQTPRILEALERYFGMEYPFDKLDLIAVPDFDSYAMENAGAVTFRDWLVLLNPSVATEEQMRAFASVTTHELAHQWFGNLVTMKWWDDLWLNEAFATWLTAKMVEELYPQYRYRVSFLASVQRAMKLDSLSTARRVREPITGYHEIQSAFDGITYQKGAGVLAMFERWVTPRVFQSSIQSYLKRYAFGNATTQQFLDEVSSAAKRDVSGPFATFLDQTGVPNVTASTRCGGDGAGELTLTQQRYTPLGSASDASPRWQVPVCVRYGRANATSSDAGAATRVACTLLQGASTAMKLEFCPAWVHPQAHGDGYYHWSTNEKNYASLEQDAWPRLTGEERLSMVHALTSMFDAGEWSERAIRAHFGTAVRHEDLSAIVRKPMGVYAFLHDYVKQGADKRAIAREATELYEPVFRRLFVEDRARAPRSATLAGEERLLLGSTAEFLALDVHAASVRRELVGVATRWMQGPSSGSLSPRDSDVLAPALTVWLDEAPAESQRERSEALVARLRQTEDAVTRGKILRALGQVNQPAAVEVARALMLSEATRTNEKPLVLASQMNDPRMRESTWAWMQANIARLMQTLSFDDVGELPEFADGFCTEEKAREVQLFFTERLKNVPGGPRSTRMAVETIRRCAAKAAHYRQSPPHPAAPSRK